MASERRRRQWVRGIQARVEMIVETPSTRRPAGARNPCGPGRGSVGSSLAKDHSGRLALAHLQLDVDNGQPPVLVEVLPADGDRYVGIVSGQDSHRPGQFDAAPRLIGRWATQGAMRAAVVVPLTQCWIGRSMLAAANGSPSNRIWIGNGPHPWPLGDSPRPSIRPSCPVPRWPTRSSAGLWLSSAIPPCKGANGSASGSPFCGQLHVRGANCRTNAPSVERHSFYEGTAL